MRPKKNLAVLAAILLSVSLACGTISFTSDSNSTGGEDPTPSPIPNLERANSGSPDEPVLITGTIPFTSPFFLDSAEEPFILLEDQAGFVARNEEFEFPLEGQTIGPVWQVDDSTFAFSLTLPAVPQGTFVDVDNNSQTDKGVMVFQVAYWSNIWGGPFLEKREGTGWSSAHCTAITDPFRDYEYTGGYLVIWSPDDAQSFPTGFGADAKLFTGDDPVTSVPAGYSIVDMNSEPFNIYKEAHPEFELYEGPLAVNDFTDMSYEDAFNAMFEQVRVEYPFTADKGIDWDALFAQTFPQVEKARNDREFYRALRDFTLAIPDSHVGVSFDADVFYEDMGGSFGLVLEKLSDGRVIATQVLDGTTGARAGIHPGAEIITWGGQPALDALAQAPSFFNPASTPQSLLQLQLVGLTRYPPNTRINLTFQNPGGSPQEVELVAEVEYDSLFAALYYFQDENSVGLPIEGRGLDGGIAYFKINSFGEDLNLSTQVWQHYIQDLIDNDVTAVIFDMRENGGGSGGLAAAFAEYFHDESIEVSRSAYYNEEAGEWEYSDHVHELEPAEVYFDGDVVVLVGPDCVSACEAFVYYLTLNGRATVIGHTGTSGGFGEVSRGQYTMPGDIDMQFPTGRIETPDGSLLLEGVGVIPDIIVPFTFESAMGQVDAVLEAALDFLR